MLRRERFETDIAPFKDNPFRTRARLPVLKIVSHRKFA